MSNYLIKDYTYEKSRMYGLVVKPSLKKGKKIDVFQNDKKIASIGDINYLDFPSYVLSHGKLYAENRRRLYRCRHNKDILIKYSSGWLAYHLLW